MPLGRWRVVALRRARPFVRHLQLRRAHEGCGQAVPQPRRLPAPMRHQRRTAADRRRSRRSVHRGEDQLRLLHPCRRRPHRRPRLRRLNSGSGSQLVFTYVKTSCDPDPRIRAAARWCAPIAPAALSGRRRARGGSPTCACRRRTACARSRRASDGSPSRMRRRCTSRERRWCVRQARSGAECSALVVQRYQLSPPWKPLASNAAA